MFHWYLMCRYINITKLTILYNKTVLSQWFHTYDTTKPYVKNFKCVEMSTHCTPLDEGTQKDNFSDTLSIGILKPVNQKRTLEQ